MLSRVADSLYWMSRYLERAENTARQLDVTMTLMLDTGSVDVEERWRRLLKSLGDPTEMEWSGSVDSMARELVFDSANPISVTFCVNGARENARQVREEISSEQWQRLNRLFHQIHSPHAQTQFGNSINEALSSVVDGIHLFQGVGDSTMIHGQGWQFIRLGRYLERAYATATMLEVYQDELFAHPERDHSGYQYLELVGLLRCCTAFEGYCQVYTADILPIAFSNSSSSIATFPTPSAIALKPSVPPLIPFSTQAAAARPTKSPPALAASTPCSALPPSKKFSPATPRPSSITFASNASAFTNSSIATTFTTPSNPHWRCSAGLQTGCRVGLRPTQTLRPKIAT